MEKMVAVLLNPRKSFWDGKRVVITGHTGFKGGWLAFWLHRLGAEVTGIALPPETAPGLFGLAGIQQICTSHMCDIRDAEALALLVRNAEPEVVFHLAAQPLVRESYVNPLATYATNIMGSAHVLEAMRSVAGVKVAVMVTTDKVYQNREWPFPYRETDTLGGHDPYSASKAASEILIQSYREAFLSEQGVAIATARAGNVIGGGDWSADRLLPDAIRAWEMGEVLDVRRPNAVRPWQHVLEPLAAYLRLAEYLFEVPDLAGAYNFGPETAGAANVRLVIEQARQAYGKGEVRYGEGSDGPHEAGILQLETAKARAVLNLHPRWSLDESIRRTMDWYRSLNEGATAVELCLADIKAFEDAA